ncbi:NADH-quinone oxidoreductase subunit NuoK [Peptococcus simiae]|uniref:NADH-quinone oxidoreductase subunit NuoK n=1 Tax=Peptococcus simiae TaxID=1643805 RepID=UPI003981866C
MIGLTHYLFLALLLFCIGLFIALSRRNPIAVLMGVELMLNAVNINLVAFNRFLNPEVAVGYVFVLLIMVVAAAEVAVGLAIVMKNYRERGRSDLSDIDWLKW